MSFFQQKLFKNRFSFFSCYLKRSSQIKIGIKIAQGFLSSEAATEGVFCKKAVHENFSMLTGKHLC